MPSEADLVARAAGNLMLNPYRAMETNARLAQGIAERSGWPKATDHSPRHQPQCPGQGQRRARTLTSRLRRCRAPDPLEQVDLGSPAVRVRRGLAGEHQEAEERDRHHGQRHRPGDLRGALREYLLRHDALPPEPLRAMVPVSIRTSKESDPWTNRVSSIFATLPTDCADPLERVARCHATMLEAKRQHELVPADVLVDLNQFSSPVLSAAASRLASQVRLADHTQPMSNLVISNVPGARQPLYLRGARLRHQYPVSIVADGLGLNITVVSYLDSFDFGFIVDRDLVPDVWDLANLHLDEIARLFEATGAEWAVPPSAHEQEVGQGKEKGTKAPRSGGAERPRGEEEVQGTRKKPKELRQGSPPDRPFARPRSR